MMSKTYGLTVGQDVALASAPLISGPSAKPMAGASDAPNALPEASPVGCSSRNAAAAPELTSPDATP